MVRELIILPDAESDILDSALWYERQQAGLGARFKTELDWLLRRIADAPRQFPKIDNEVRRGLLRHFPYGIYFLEEPSAITVIAVLHLSRHPDTWRRRL